MKFTKNLLFGKWQYLLNARRYAQHPMIDPLNVASHCWVMQILAMRILDATFAKMNITHKLQDGISVEVYRKIAVHDLEECLIGDIPRFEFGKLREKASSLKTEAMYYVDKFCFDEDNHVYMNDIKHAKHDASGLIVSYVDLLSALLEAHREKKLGNTNMDDIIGNATRLLSEMRSSWYGQLRETQDMPNFIHFALEVMNDINKDLDAICEIDLGIDNRHAIIA